MENRTVTSEALAAEKHEQNIVILNTACNCGVIDMCCSEKSITDFSCLPQLAHWFCSINTNRGFGSSSYSIVTYKYNPCKTEKSNKFSHMRSYNQRMVAISDCLIKAIH